MTEAFFLLVMTFVAGFALWVALSIREHGAHGFAFMLSDWFMAVGLGCEYGLRCWRQFQRRARMGERGTWRDTAAAEEGA